MATSTLVTCGKIGNALTSWLKNANATEVDALCDALPCSGDGSGSAPAITEAATGDTQSLKLSGNGSTASPLTGTVQVAGGADNALTVTAQGLSVSVSALSAAISTALDNSNTTTVTGAGTSANPYKVNARLATGTNLLKASATGLVVNEIKAGEIAKTASNSVTWATGNALKADVRIAPGADNLLQATSTGLKVDASSIPDGSAYYPKTGGVVDGNVTIQPPANSATNAVSVFEMVSPNGTHKLRWELRNDGSLQIKRGTNVVIAEHRSTSNPGWTFYGTTFSTAYDTL